MSNKTLSRGWVIMAQNTSTVDYEYCARLLAKRIAEIMPHENVTIITSSDLPHGDVATNNEWRLDNDWQVYEASPYDLTIKLEADMWLPQPIDHWWNVLENRDLNICTTIRDYRNQISSVRKYRKIFDESDLPDTYNAITYFKRSTLAQEFYALVRDIFENWNKYRDLLVYCPDDHATTDVVYGIAARILGSDHCTLPTFTAQSMIHMKTAIIDSLSNYWPDEFLLELRSDVFKINTFAQEYPVHYHVKEFSKTINREVYGRE